MANIKVSMAFERAILSFICFSETGQTSVIGLKIKLIIHYKNKLNEWYKYSELEKATINDMDVKNKNLHVIDFITETYSGPWQEIINEKWIK